MKLTDVEKCYASALIEGIELIDEKAREMRIDAKLDCDALVQFVRRRGDDLLQIYNVEIPKPPVDRKAHWGRGGIPALIVEQMIDVYRETGSLAKTGKRFGRTRQSMWQILRGRINLNDKMHGRTRHEPVVYNGERFTPGKGGYLRPTENASRKKGRTLHRVMWEEHRGPVPPDHQVMFRDGDKTNCSIENLYILSRPEAARRKPAINAWTKFRQGRRSRPEMTPQSRQKLRTSLARAWATMTSEERAARVSKAARGRWRLELKEAA